MRTIVDLPSNQVRALSSLCQAKKISRAEAVRRAIDHWIKKTGMESPDEAFGLWKKRKINARKYIEKLRSEWNS